MLVTPQNKHVMAHSIMPDKSGRTNGWGLHSGRLSTETFGRSVSWVLLSPSSAAVTFPWEQQRAGCALA